MLGVRLLFGGVWAAFISCDAGKRLFSDGHAMSAIEMRITSPPNVKRGCMRIQSKMAIFGDHCSAIEHTHADLRLSL